MKVSANKAAQLVGKSPPTISRAIKSGKLSHEKAEGGGYLIEESELYRVWPRVTVEDNAKGNTLNDETPYETRVLEVELKAERDMRSRLESEIEDLKGQRDKWQGQAERLLLEKATPAPVETMGGQGGFIARLFGK